MAVKTVSLHASVTLLMKGYACW